MYTLCLILRVVVIENNISIPTSACITSNVKYSNYSISFFDKANHVQVNLPLDTNISYGDCYQLSEVEEIENKYWNPSSFDYQQYTKSNLIIYKAEATKLVGNKQVLFKRLKNKRLTYINNNCHKNKQVCKYSNALLLGYNKIDSNIKDRYGQIGIAPLFAISGMHITLFYLVLFGLGARLRVVENQNRRICLFLVAIYSILAGSSVAVNRALMMLLFRLEFKQTGIRAFIYTLGIALIANPFNILNKGFLLSYIITLVIICLSQSEYYRQSPLKLSLLCYLISLPISYSFSYSFNLLAPIAIIIFYPVISFVLIPLSILTTLFNSQLVTSIYLLAVNVINSCVRIINVFSVTSGHISNLLWIVYLLLVIILVKNFKIRNIGNLIIWFLLVSINFHNIPIVTFMDVGQGDSALIQYHFKNYLVDTGDAGSELIDALSYFGVHSIDGIFLSHAHKDHYGALEELSKAKSIKAVYELNNNQVFSGSIGLENDFRGKYIEVYPYYGSNDNDRELIVKFKYKGYSILFPGDVELESEQYLFNNYCTDIDSDIIKVPHHGSKTSSSDDLLSCVTPTIAVISSGRNNMYNHPDSGVVGRYSTTSQVYNTKLDGQISFKISSHGIKKISR